MAAAGRNEPFQMGIGWNSLLGSVGVRFGVLILIVIKCGQLHLAGLHFLVDIVSLDQFGPFSGQAGQDH